MSEPMKPSAEAISKVNLLLQELGWGLPVTAIRVALRNAYAIDFADQRTLIDGLVEALENAVKAGEYVVKLVEDTGACGDSPNPNLKADWLGTAMHCYAAMAFLSHARAALAQAKGVQR